MGATWKAGANSGGLIEIESQRPDSMKSACSVNTQAHVRKAVSSPLRRFSENLVGASLPNADVWRVVCDFPSDWSSKSCVLTQSSLDRWQSRQSQLQLPVH